MATFVVKIGNNGLFDRQIAKAAIRGFVPLMPCFDSMSCTVRFIVEEMAKV
jgi:hypothetical protein